MTNAEIDPTVPVDRGHPPVIAIGASAGGLEALTAMLAKAAPEIAAAVVVIQHLSPDQKSILHELLQSSCEIPVTQIQQDETVEPGRVYVVPPGTQAELRDGTLHLSDRAKTDQPFRPIDHFFNSLADDLGRDAYCVVLSGTGSDGSDGLRSVKSAGGFAIVQEVENARFPGMPDAAIATGLVDFILPAKSILPRLTEIIAHRGDAHTRHAREQLVAQITEALPDVFKCLCDATGHDFTDYKPGTVLRRIERRMALMRVRDVDAFLQVIADDEKEANLLAHDFLIGVTQFFRDADAFAALKSLVVDPIVAGKPDTIRVWVPGCSTGEEVYSLAILFNEALEEAGFRATLQMFGTDIDSHALAAARNGVFTPAAVEGLSKSHLERYFQPENGQYTVSAKLREACVFAPHNLVQDPPFSRLDLISCRNVLIYLSNRLQKRVLPRFHFSLNPGGHMFLGPSEGLAGEDQLFKVIDKIHRIFQRNDEAANAYSSLSEDVPQARAASRKALPVGAPALPAAQQPVAATREIAAQQAFLARHAAPFAVVSASGDVRYLSHAMTRFARPAKGAPSNQIDSFLSTELRVPVRSALTEAIETGAEQAVPGVLVAVDTDSPTMYDFTLSPMDGALDDFLLVLSEVRATDTDNIEDAIDLRETMDHDILVGENARLRRQLTEVMQNFETSGQELKSTNEELMSMNEELQSSNEELETSREELQSINEELETVNSELRENNRRLTRANSDLKNLFESTDIAVIFLDRNFILRSYTPAATALYGVKDRDIGRPIFDLHARINYPDLRADAKKVDATLQPLEHEVSIAETDETFLLRIKPYRTTDDRIDGYVLSFVDITLRKRDDMVLERNRAELARQFAELENLYDTTPVGLCLVDRDFRWLRINEKLAEINGHSVEAHVGKTFNELLPDIADGLKHPYATVFKTGEPLMGIEIEGEVPASPGMLRSWVCDFYPIRDAGTVFAVGGCVREVTDQKRLVAELEHSQAHMKRLFDIAPLFIITTEGPDHLVTYANPLIETNAGAGVLVGKPLQETMPEFVEQGFMALWDRVYATGETIEIPEAEARAVNKVTGEETVGHYAQRLEPIKDNDGQTIGIASFGYDLTEVVAARLAAQESEQQKTLLLGELQHRVKNTLATIRAISRLLLPGSSDAASYQKRLSDRLSAIARTHDVLFGENFASIGLHALVASEAAPYQTQDASRVTCTGADIALSAEEATSVGMALHEMMTNAAKYGALSVPEGRIEIKSHVDAKTRAQTVTWRESGGPPVEDPGEATGFGSIVINQVLSSNLDGEVSMDFLPDGLSATITWTRFEGEAAP